MIEVYLKHRPNKLGYTDYWKEVFQNNQKYKIYELTEEDRPDCVYADKNIFKNFGGVFASHMTSFLHSTSDFHWAIDAEDIKFEKKYSTKDVSNLFSRVEEYAIENNLDGISYDMYLSILGGESKIGPSGKQFKEHIPHWTFGMAFLKKNNNILNLIFDRYFENPWNADWRMSELKYKNILNLKTFIVQNATVHHTWGDIVVIDKYLIHGGDPSNPSSKYIFDIKEEVIPFQFI